MWLTLDKGTGQGSTHSHIWGQQVWLTLDKGMDEAPLTCPLAVCRGLAPPTESEPDEGFEWVTPDESTRLPFIRSPEAALQLAQEWDLCISGDGLLHLQHIGAEPVYIPLAQVRVGWGPSLLRLRHSGSLAV